MNLEATDFSRFRLPTSQQAFEQKQAVVLCYGERM